MLALLFKSEGVVILLHPRRYWLTFAMLWVYRPPLWIGRCLCEIKTVPLGMEFHAFTHGYLFDGSTGPDKRMHVMQP
jgi:hypothetical protein